MKQKTAVRMEDRDGLGVGVGEGGLVRSVVQRPSGENCKRAAWWSWDGVRGGWFGEEGGFRAGKGSE